MDNSPEETLAIGLDVGGTKLAGGIVAFPSGKILFKHTVPTRVNSGGEAVLDDALRVAETLLTEARSNDLQVEGIGVGVCELVNPDGDVTSSHQVAWRGLPVQAAFNAVLPAHIESDVRASGLAEAILGAGSAFNLVVFVSIGTGISYCLVQDKQPYAGAHGNALILASSPLTTICSNCGEILYPILEDMASGPALVSQLNDRRMADHVNERLVERGEDVLAAVELGDPRAIQIVQTAGEAAGVSIGWLVNVLDPAIVIVGGGLGSAAGLYWDSLVKSTRCHIWSETHRDLPIEQATFGAEAGIIGAAASFVQKQQPHYFNNPAD